MPAISESLWRGPWPWVAAALILAAYAVARHFLAPEAARDPRPIGTAEDILALRERRDLNVLFILIDRRALFLYLHLMDVHESLVDAVGKA